MQPTIQPFFDPATWTVTYVVYQEERPECAIIDSVLDYDPKAGRTSTASADKVIAFVREHELQVEWILETHAHADHLSAAPYLRSQVGGKIAIGQHIRSVQGVFKKLFNLEPEFRLDGSQFDHLFEENEEFAIGGLTGKALHVPGHTPADMAYQIGMQSSSATRCSCPTSARPAATFPVAMRTSCTAPSASCWTCRAIPASSCVTTIRPRAVGPHGKRPYMASVKATFTCTMA